MAPVVAQGDLVIPADAGAMLEAALAQPPRALVKFSRAISR